MKHTGVVFTLVHMTHTPCMLCFSFPVQVFGEVHGISHGELAARPKAARRQSQCTPAVSDVFCSMAHIEEGGSNLGPFPHSLPGGHYFSG